MIQIQNLHYCYPDGTKALNNINLNISEGEFFLLCGPNGSGKTTLLRLISGLFKPTSGTIWVNGLDLLTHSKEIRTLVGIIFQDPDSQILGETVREDVSFGPENMRLPGEEIQERVYRALQKMNLAYLSEKPCYLLSSGEKRRLAIAGVMAMKPRVILFDEPFAYLDFLGIQEVLKYMIELHREGHTLIVTTHDVEKVIAHVDRMAILQKGEIKALGKPDEVTRDLYQFGVRPPCYVLLGKEKISWLE
jgi:cobalt transport protein ATP-binding subunit